MTDSPPTQEHPEAEVRLVDTPEGPARARILAGRGSRRGTRATGTVLLSHGAGGRRDSADLVALAAALPQSGWTVALVDQPWRVAGRRIATAPPRLDAAYVPLVHALLSGRDALPRPVVSVGRSAGARVVCRTAERLGPDAVLAVSFPLHPPGRPTASRYAELAAAVALAVPVRVIQGQQDTFGTPAELIEAGLDPNLVVPVRGTHTPHPGDVAAAAVRLLGELFG